MVMAEVWSEFGKWGVVEIVSSKSHTVSPDAIFCKATAAYLRRFARRFATRCRSLR